MNEIPQPRIINKYELKQIIPGMCSRDNITSE